MSAPINIFIIYAREDKEIKQRILLHLNPFKNVFNAVIWHDEFIEAGQEWKPHIESRLQQTDLFLLLVSIDFMNSEFINQVEFKYAIERHKAKKSIVIPVIINYCQWNIDIDFKEFNFNLDKLQVLPNEARPIDDWKTPDQAFNNIAAGIRIVLSTIKNNREKELIVSGKHEPEIEKSWKGIEERQVQKKREKKVKNKKEIAKNKNIETEIKVTDVDGNKYDTIVIGTQTWMKENLKTTHYRNGETIPNIQGDKRWANLTNGAYCNYENDVANSGTYGLLYNWHAINDPRGLAPKGWHIPSDAEWETLIFFLGGKEVAGGKMKERGITHWASPNTGATNSSGFAGLPSCQLDGYGKFATNGWGYWWSSTKAGTEEAYACGVYWNSIQTSVHSYLKIHGFSIRCVRD